jgi:hypothetical protein
MTGNQYLERIRPASSMLDQDHNRISQEKWVWIADPKECFVAGYILNETNETATIKLESGEVCYTCLMEGKNFETLRY